MSDSSSVLYKYTIPLKEEDGVEKPSYEPNYDGTVVVSKYRANDYVFVKDETIPHFHKDSVNVSVEEVDADGYDYEPTEDTTEEPEEGGEE